jgi:hypothetical protein
VFILLPNKIYKMTSHHKTSFLDLKVNLGFSFLVFNLFQKKKLSNWSISVLNIFCSMPYLLYLNKLHSKLKPFCLLVIQYMTSNHLPLTIVYLNPASWTWNSFMLSLLTGHKRFHSGARWWQKSHMEGHLRSTSNS